jgi:hypothetical protein
MGLELDLGDRPILLDSPYGYWTRSRLEDGTAERVENGTPGVAEVRETDGRLIVAWPDGTWSRIPAHWVKSPDAQE